MKRLIILLVVLLIGFYLFSYEPDDPFTRKSRTFDRPIHFTGQIRNLADNPVGDVVVQGRVNHIGLESEAVTAKTSDSGVFEISGKSGSSLTIVGVDSTVYRMVGGQAVVFPSNEESGLDNTFYVANVYHSESIKDDEIEIINRWGGETTYHDLFDGSEPWSSTISVFTWREKTKERKGRLRFPWRVNLSVVGGGILEKIPSMPLVAPMEGYQSDWELELLPEDRDWWSGGERLLFYKANGFNGLLRVHIDSDGGEGAPSVYIWGRVNSTRGRLLDF